MYFRIYLHYYLLQGWPRTNVDPLTTLLTLFVYEKRTGEVLYDQQICNGKLKDLLQPEDFANAEKILAFSLLLCFLLNLLYTHTHNASGCELLSGLSSSGTNSK